MSSSFADLNLYPFSVISHNCGWHSFSEFCESFVKPEGGLEDLQQNVPGPEPHVYLKAL